MIKKKRSVTTGNRIALRLRRMRISSMSCIWQEQVKDILIRHFGGYTIQEASGGWIDEGTVYQEYTLVIYLSDTTEEAVHAAADEMIETFRQSSVLIQTNPTRTEFYSGS